jgi:hypothetical protein
MHWLPLLLALAGACSRGATPAVQPAAAGQGPASVPLTLEHDFGVIPHGETRQHEFRVDLARLDGRWAPLRVHLDCACGHADLRLRRADGTERFADPANPAANLLEPGEALWLRVVIDTATKEAVDQKIVPSRGFIVLQRPDDSIGSSRIQWPVLVRFGVESPVDLRPVAALDLGRVPQSGHGLAVSTLRGDERHRDATFGPATSSDPALAPELVKEEDHWLLRVTGRPGDVGHHRAVLSIANSIPGYRLELPVTWKVVPDLEARPLAKLSFRAALDRAQTEAEAVGQFVLLVDHDERRDPEFAVRRVVDDAGRDVAAHFAVTFEPVGASPRQRRMLVRYVGGLTQSMRGSLELTKNGEHGPFLPIELVLFSR